MIHHNAKQVRVRYGGVSDMTLWRWLRDKDLGFPQPLLINGRRYWLEAELLDWEQKQAQRRQELASVHDTSAESDEAARAEPAAASPRRKRKAASRKRSIELATLYNEIKESDREIERLTGKRED